MQQDPEAGIGVNPVTDLYCTDTDMIRGEGTFSRGVFAKCLLNLQDFDNLWFSSHVSSAELRELLLNLSLSTEHIVN